MTLTYPIVPEEDDDNVREMFESVDYVHQGYDKGNHVFTFYSDLNVEASALLKIFPAFVAFVYGEDAVDKWLQPTAVEDCEGVNFAYYNNDGEWNGTWTTRDDKVYKDTMEEKMPIGEGVGARSMSSVLQPKLKNPPCVITHDSFHGISYTIFYSIWRA